MDWQVGETVMIWSVKGQNMYAGVVQNVDNTLQILVHSSGKVYNYNLDGSAITVEGCTNQRVFSVRQLNEVVTDERTIESAGNW